MTPEIETASPAAGINGGDGSAQQSPVLLRQVNQVQATEGEDVAKEFLPEDAVTKDVEDEANTSTAKHTHDLSETSRGNWTIF